MGLRFEKWSRTDWSKVDFSNFVAERSVSEDFWIYFYRMSVSCVMPLFFPVLAHSVSPLVLCTA